MEDNLEPTNGPDDILWRTGRRAAERARAGLDDARKSSIAEHLDDIFDDERDDLQGGLPDDADDAAVPATSGDGAVVASAGGSGGSGVNGTNGTNGANGYDGGGGAGNVRPALIEQEMGRRLPRLRHERDRGPCAPGCRDGLKPVHRRILYAMHDMGLTQGKPYQQKRPYRRRGAG